MKNTIKLISFIALVSVIGFSMTSCNNGVGGGGSKKKTETVQIPNELRGTWKWTEGSKSVTVVYTSTTSTVTRAGFSAENSGTLSYEVTTIGTFTVAAPYNATYPKGYVLGLKVTKSNIADFPVGWEEINYFAVNSTGTEAINDVFMVYKKQK